MQPERLSLFCLKLSHALGVPLGLIERACEDALDAKINSTVLHSGRCPQCGIDIAGPIANIDDVKWSLGNSILGDPVASKENYDQLVSVANEQVELLDLQGQLKAKMEQGFLNAYFDEHLRQGIKDVIEKIDSVSSGARCSVDSSHGKRPENECHGRVVLGVQHENSGAALSCAVRENLIAHEFGAMVDDDENFPPRMFAMD
jgi:hypothetical protein